MLRVGRDRERHKRLPKGWAPGPVRKDGTRDIYFRPTNEADRRIVKAITGGPLSLRLGSDHNEAAQAYARLIVAAREKETAYEPGTVGEICAKVREHLLPTIENLKTRSERARHCDALEQFAGRKRYARNVYEASRDTSGQYLRAMDVQARIFAGKKTRAVGVNREVRSWEIFFIWARAPWGLTEYNPCSGLMMNDEKPRRIVPQHNAIAKLYRHLSPPARFMVAIIRYYGRRKVEQLGIDIERDVLEDGIHLRRGKDAESKEIILKWDPRLKRHYARYLAWRATVIRPTIEGNVVDLAKRRERKVTTKLLVNSRGRPMTETGFNSERKRAMVRAGIQGAFTFHDMRKTRAHDNLTLQEAQHILAHDDQRTTSAIYRPGAIVVDMNEEVARRGKKKEGTG